jgi:hypothetical protein
LSMLCMQRSLWDLKDKKWSKFFPGDKYRFGRFEDSPCFEKKRYISNQ